MKKIVYQCAFSMVTCSLILLAGCTHPPPTQTDQSLPDTEIRISSLPPAPKNIINALLDSKDIPLTVDPSCYHVGTSWNDATIGQYISGLLAELSDPEYRNSIQVEVSPQNEQQEPAGWLVKVTAGQFYDEVKWRWGVAFLILGNGTIDPTSYRCIGAG